MHDDDAQALAAAVTPPPADWALSFDDQVAHGVSSEHGCMSVYGDGAAMFKRNAIKGVGSGASRHERWLVGELDGVRCYFDGRRVVLTTEDLYP